MFKWITKPYLLSLAKQAALRILYKFLANGRQPNQTFGSLDAGILSKSSVTGQKRLFFKRFASC